MNRRMMPWILMVGCLLLVAQVAAAETLTKTFFHQLLVTDPATSFEHRIDLPEEAAMAGKYFIKRSLDLRMGKLVVEREEFTPQYYYVKVRLPKLVGQPMAGQIKIDLEIGTPVTAPAVEAPTKLKLFEHAAALKPVFTWTTKERYAMVTLYDLDEQKTVWERVSTLPGYIGFDEGYIAKHRYMWAVRVGNEYGKWSTEVQARFHIETQDGIVVAVEE